MITSYQAPQEVQCPICGRVTSWDVWLVVNTEERPDLLDRIRDATIRELTCPGCGKVAWSALPLAVYNPSGFPRAVIMTTDENRPLFEQLASTLQAQAGDDWPPGEAFHWAPHSIMPQIFKRDVRADMTVFNVRPGDESPAGQLYFDFLQRLRVAARASS
jgi:hypothetical protein